MRASTPGATARSLPRPACPSHALGAARRPHHPPSPPPSALQAGLRLCGALVVVHGQLGLERGGSLLGGCGGARSVASACRRGSQRLTRATQHWSLAHPADQSAHPAPSAISHPATPAARPAPVQLASGQSSRPLRWRCAVAPSLNASAAPCGSAARPSPAPPSSRSSPSSANSSWRAALAPGKACGAAGRAGGRGRGRGHQACVLDASAADAECSSRTDCIKAPQGQVVAASPYAPPPGSASSPASRGEGALGTAGGNRARHCRQRASGVAAHPPRPPPRPAPPAAGPAGPGALRAATHGQQGGPLTSTPAAGSGKMQIRGCSVRRRRHRRLIAGSDPAACALTCPDRLSSGPGAVLHARRSAAAVGGRVVRGGQTPGIDGGRWIRDVACSLDALQQLPQQRHGLGGFGLCEQRQRCNVRGAWGRRCCRQRGRRD